ncbi:MAG TPA: hypothetical protein VLB84_05685, partial [Bacteroidia bacterium]|nr:hypothetical protein [Bacteroidia bacterium]
MLKKSLLIIAIFAFIFSTFAQSSKNISLLSNLTFPSNRGDLNDIWGIKKGSNEYALVGFETGVAIVDVTT